MSKAFKNIYRVDDFVILKQVSRNSMETKRIDNNEEIQIHQYVDGIAYSISIKKNDLIDLLNKEVKL